MKTPMEGQLNLVIVAKTNCLTMMISGKLYLQQKLTVHQKIIYLIENSQPCIHGTGVLLKDSAN